MYSIDATECERMGKYVNDAPKKHANCIAKSLFLHEKPRVLLFASRDIPANAELRYDYGGKHLPWRQVRTETIQDAACLYAS